MENNTYIVACENLKPELTSVMKNHEYNRQVFWIGEGCNPGPDKLRMSVQNILDMVPFNSTVLLAFGLCKDAMVGINAGVNTVILPRIADCVALKKVSGNVSLIDALLDGNWSSRYFIIIPPGKSVLYEDSLSAAKQF